MANPGVEPVTVHSIQELIKETVANWNKIDEPRLGAALTFYTMLSIAPLLVISIAIAGFVFSSQAAQNQIIWKIQHLAGTEGGRAIETMLQHATKPGQGIIAGTLGIVTLLLGASGVFLELRDDLNLIWEVKPQVAYGLKGIVRQRFLAFAMVVGIGFLLLVSLLLSAGIEAAGKHFGGSLLIPVPALELANVLLSIVGITVLFAAVYKIVPNRRMEWRDVWIGAAVSSLLFSVGKLLIGIYLGWAGVGSEYGAAGSLVMFLVWVYYSALIFFFGAEFTHAFAKRYGSLALCQPMG